MAPSTTPTPGGGGSGESRNYYIDVTINNYGSDPLDIKYLIAQGGDQKVETAEAMTAVGINLTISATSQPPAISFQAFKQGKGFNTGYHTTQYFVDLLFFYQKLLARLASF